VAQWTGRVDAGDEAGAPGMRSLIPGAKGKAGTVVGNSDAAGVNCRDVRAHRRANALRELRLTRRGIAAEALCHLRHSL